LPVTWNRGTKTCAGVELQTAGFEVGFRPRKRGR
jgi:hypothetical protein